MEIVSFAGVFLNPSPPPLGTLLYQIVFWVVIASLLAYGMYRRSRFAWSVALVLAGIDLFFALPPSVGLIPLSDAGRALAWTVWASIIAVTELVILTSSRARAWIAAEPVAE